MRASREGESFQAIPDVDRRHTMDRDVYLYNGGEGCAFGSLSIVTTDTVAYTVIAIAIPLAKVAFIDVGPTR
jgi:hypothetical protein